MELITGAAQVPEKDIDYIEEKMEKWKFIIQSMTKDEKQDPDLMNSSRVKRIAKGSGRSEKEIKELLNRYKQSKQMMKASKGRGMRQLLKKLGANQSWIRPELEQQKKFSIGINYVIVVQVDNFQTIVL